MTQSITIEEAVARMVNVKNIPDNTSLDDFLSYLVTLAEEEYSQAEERNLSYEQLQLIQKKINAATARFELACELIQHISWELDTLGDRSLLKLSPDSSSHKRLEVDSVIKWAEHHYDIQRLDYEELTKTRTEKPILKIEKEAVNISKKGLSGMVAKRLYVVLAYVIEELVEAKKNPTGFGTKENINVQQTAELILTSIQAFKGNSRFYDIETLKSRIEIARAMKKLYGKN